MGYVAPDDIWIRFALVVGIWVGTFLLVSYLAMRSNLKHDRLRVEAAGDKFSDYSFKDMVDCYGGESASAGAVVSFIAFFVAAALLLT